MKKISEKTRVSRAGFNYAASIIENVHLFYLNDNALEYLNALLKGLKKEFKRRSKLERGKQ